MTTLGKKTPLITNANFSSDDALSLLELTLISRRNGAIGTPLGKGTITSLRVSLSIAGAYSRLAAIITIIIPIKSLR